MWRSLVLFAALVGCGNSPGEVSGTIDGHAFSVAASISATSSRSTGSSTEAFIMLSSSTDICGPADAQVRHPGEQIIIISLWDNPMTPTAPTAPGTFTILDPTGGGYPQKPALFIPSTLDATCSPRDTPVHAVSGTVTLTAIDHDVYAGHFDVTFSSGEHITGTFDPVACADLPADIYSVKVPTCEPDRRHKRDRDGIRAAPRRP